MRAILRIWFALVISVTAAFAASAQVLTKFRTVPNSVPGEYIVVLDPRPAATTGATIATADALAAMHGGKVHFYYDAVLQGFSVWISADAARALSERPDVTWVEEVGIGHPAGTQNVGANLANLDRVDQHNAPLNGVYNYPLSGQGVHIYIVDTGIRFTHNEFGGRADGVHDSVNDGNGMDDHCDNFARGHGTHVASLAAGATFGTSKSARLHAVRVIDCNDNGSAAQFIDGLNWLAANAQHPAVANISLRYPGQTSIDTAVQNLINIGIQAVIAAGNDYDADACTVSPARVGPAVTVGATGGDNYQTVSAFSNQGSCLDLFAPGETITAACHDTDACNEVSQGTSFAAPMVAGTLAMYLAGNPSATPATVVNQLLANATNNVLNAASLTAGSPNVFLYSAYPQCTSGTTCADACVNLQSDRNNCGACGVVCEGAQVCSAGICGCQFPPKSCPPNYYWDDIACRCSQ